MKQEKLGSINSQINKNMHADLKGALRAIKTSWKAFEHNGNPMTKDQVKIIIEYGINRGYKTTKDFKENEIDKILNNNDNYG